MPNGPSTFTDHTRQGPKSPQLPQGGWELDAGPPPAGVIRRFQANDRGIIGDDVNTFPTDGSEQIVDATIVVKSPFSSADRRGIPTVDDTLYVPAFAVGDPR